MKNSYAIINNSVVCEECFEENHTHEDIKSNDKFVEKASIHSSIDECVECGDWVLVTNGKASDEYELSKIHFKPSLSKVRRG